ncbi:MAG: DUF4253 domain-containing protein [Candidatus Melainabacteria bacterium]|nr:MAG: DUF4253 domain-containing protein [Candidatus Melainabacteria bacterium]
MLNFRQVRGILLIGICSIATSTAMAEDAGLTLSESERKLAGDMNFDTRVLEIVKERTGTTFTRIDINSMDSLAASRIFLHQLSESEKTKWIVKLEQIKATYPELKNVLDQEIERTKNLSEPQILKQPETEFQKRRTEILNEYQPYIRQEFESMRSKLPPGASVMWNMNFPHFKDNDELLANLKKQFDGVVLQEKYKPEPGLKFNLPYDMKRASEEISLQIKLEGADDGMANMPSSAFYGSLPSRINIELNEKLNPLGYTVYGTDAVRNEAHFYDLEEAKTWLASFENQLIYSEITKSPSFTFEHDFDPEAPQILNQSNHFGLAPFSTITKVSKGKWKITTSPSYTVHTILFQAILSKTDKGAKTKFNPIVSAGTSGCNYAVSNEMIIEKLQKWDKLYKVKLLNAKHDSLTISFEKLPEDLSHLCTEMWLFCPDLLEIDPGDYEQKAAVMKDFARKLKEKKEVSFWWD